MEEVLRAEYLHALCLKSTGFFDHPHNTEIDVTSSFELLNYLPLHPDQQINSKAIIEIMIE